MDCARGTLVTDVDFVKITKDTRDKNEDKSSWPLSCCIPDLPLDKSDPTEIFRGPQ